MNLFGKYYSWLSVGIFAALVLVVAYYIGTRTGKGKATAAASEAQKKEFKKSALTYDLSQYSTWADNLYTAMFGINDEDAIYAVFSKLRTKSDLLQLISAFGSRRIQFTVGSNTLTEWIYNRLDKSEQAKINEILARNDIQFEF